MFACLSTAPGLAKPSSGGPTRQSREPSLIVLRAGTNRVAAAVVVRNDVCSVCVVPSYAHGLPPRHAEKSPFAVVTSKLWHPLSWRFMLLRTLKALPHPVCGHLNGFSPVCEWLWMRRLLGRLKALLHVEQTYRS